MTRRRSLGTIKQVQEMEKLMIGKCRSQFWCVILVSFFFTLLLLYFHYSMLAGGITSKANSYLDSVVSREPNFLQPVGNSSKTINLLPITTGHPVGQITEDFIVEFDKQIATQQKEEESNNGGKNGETPISKLLSEPSHKIPVSKHENSVVEDRAKSSSVILRELNSPQPVGNSRETISLLPITTGNPVGEVAELFMTESDNQIITQEKEEESINSGENGEKPMSKLPSEVSHQVPVSKNENSVVENRRKPDSCSGRYIYMHNLPSKFNKEMLNNCRLLNVWINMCPYIINSGLGPEISNSQNVFSKHGWFSTNQFTLEVIFHNRMKQYECLTNNSSLATAIYVPFYAGFDVSRYLWTDNTAMKDSTLLELLKWVSEKPEWKSMSGRNHFLVKGRISWDFRRLSDNVSDWGNKLLLLPESRNMTILGIESSLLDKNDIAIPYPTYFHPSSEFDVIQWQNRVRKQRRKYLFSFVGAPRPNLLGSIRGEIIDQCMNSRGKCKLLNCNSDSNKCDNPVNVMKMFQNSLFCLQPPGDSYTRRSAFDSILAGCIPVFFHPGSAYVQYVWHLPKNYSTYSVFIPENDVKSRKVRIEKRLRMMSKEEVVAMREEVIKLIPVVVYADPRLKKANFEDAFDIAVKGVLERVEIMRREMEEGKDSVLELGEENGSKYDLFGSVEKHDFSKTKTEYS